MKPYCKQFQAIIKMWILKVAGAIVFQFITIKSKTMWRPNLANRTFDWMGERFSPLIDKAHFLGHSPIGYPKWNLPAVNILKKGNLFEMEIAVPGFKKDELEVIVKDDILTICGEKKAKNGQKDARYILEEYNRDYFERRFRLGEGIGHEKIQAVYHEGLLKLTFTDVPKEAERDYQEVMIN